MMHCIRRSFLVGSDVQKQVSNKEISNWIMYEFVGLLGFRVRLLEINQVLESIRQAFHHQDRVGSLRGGIEFMELCGFEKMEGGEFLFLPRDKIDPAIINSAGTELNSAINNPFFGVL
ncbi:hypothetical protein F2Q68_00014689 [Brassica cretica]|uniref:Uncharacterized protein n=1 Tax=Brassica cretica TaxID=69181 RepID=A0A8S9HFS5_BRACR|nr:hypothetical protein F2Q68_00014689 [Brassica cretica]